MNYEPLDLKDVETVKPFFSMVDSRTCDFTVGGMFMWRDYYRMEYAIEDGVFFSRLRDKDGNLHYNLPISENIGDSVKKLIDSTKLPIKFCTIPEKYVPLFSNCGHDVRANEQTDFADYLYNASDLVTLAGRKYSGQRNLIKQFKRSVSEWNFEPIEGNDIGKIRDFFCDIYLPMSSEGTIEKEENRKVLEVLENGDKYGMFGGYLTADGEIVGFSMNEIVGDTLFSHIEKADRRYKGAYQMLVNQSAAAFVSDKVLFINREEDMGDLGLRASKRSYHPTELLKKFVVEVF